MMVKKLFEFILFQYDLNTKNILYINLKIFIIQKDKCFNFSVQKWIV